MSAAPGRPVLGFPVERIVKAVVWARGGRGDWAMPTKYNPWIHGLQLMGLKLTFTKNKSIRDGHDTRHRLSDINNKRCTFPRCKPFNPKLAQKCKWTTRDLRAKNTVVRDVECWGIEFFK